MWPYNDEEAVWLTPPKPAERPVHASSVNDNDPLRRVPARPVANLTPVPAPRKSERET